MIAAYVWDNAVYAFLNMENNDCWTCAITCASYFFLPKGISHLKDIPATYSFFKLIINIGSMRAHLWCDGSRSPKWFVFLYEYFLRNIFLLSVHNICIRMNFEVSFYKIFKKFLNVGMIAELPIGSFF